MVNDNEKTRWDFIGKEPEPEEKRKPEEEPEIVTTPARPEDFAHAVSIRQTPPAPAWTTPPKPAAPTGRRKIPTFAKWIFGFLAIGLLIGMARRFWPEQGTKKSTENSSLQSSYPTGSVSEANILRTYRPKNRKDARFLQLRRNNTYMIGFFGKWQIHPKLYEVIGFPKQPLGPGILSPGINKIGRLIFLSSHVVPDRLYVEVNGEALAVSGSGVEKGYIDTQGEVIGTMPPFVREKGSKIVKNIPGKIWSRYVNRNGDFLEFRKDGSYLRSLEVGKWKKEGNIIKFYPKGKENSWWESELKNETCIVRLGSIFGSNFVLILGKED